MIKVNTPIAPDHYIEKVRDPGLLFLQSNPNPTRRDWKANGFWKEIHQDLYDALGGICSYCATFTPRRKDKGTDGAEHTSVDHFIPKSQEKKLAYEWTNFRLCRAKLNTRKGNHNDVVDPYTLVDGHFFLDFSSLLIKPNPSLSEENSVRIDACINRLQLNDDDDYVAERARAVYGYASNKVEMHFLKRYYPFIAMEIETQDFDATYRPIYEAALRSAMLKPVLKSKKWID